MNQQEFVEFCIGCADALSPTYGEALPARVRAHLWGGERSGSPRHMDGGIAHAVDIAALLVSMLSVAVSIASHRLAVKTAPPVLADSEIAAIERAIEAEIDNLGDAQQEPARDLKREICEWLRSRGNR